MQVKLSEKEKKFLSRMEKWNENSSFNYVAIGMAFCLAILGLVIGFMTESKDGFLMAIYFGTLGIFAFITFRVYQKFIRIIKKLKG